MKKQLLPITLGLALMAIAGTAYAQTAATTTTTDSTAKTHQGEKPFDKAKMRHGFASTELLALLNIDEATLQTELKAGKSLAAIAVEKGATKQQVIDLLVKEETARIDKSVTDGKVTQANADKRKAALVDNVTKRVDQVGGQGREGFDGKGPGGKGPGGKGGPGGHEGMKGGGFEEAAAIIGYTAQEISDKFKAGESLTEIAQEKGITKEQLVDALLKKEQERINKRVDQKWQAKTPAPAATPVTN
jgi:predicted transcriptional regulator